MQLITAQEKARADLGEPGGQGHGGTSNKLPQPPADVKPLDHIRDALDGHDQSDGSIMARCPAHDDRTPSLHLTADGDKLLVHCLAGCSQGDVIQALRDRGLWPGSNGDTPTEIKLPLGIPRRWYGAPYVAHWTYRDSQGQVIGYVARFEGPEGKQVVPFFKAKGSEWRAGAAPAPRPLYGLDKLAQQPELSVIIPEGEKAADAAGWLLQGRYVAITWPGGSNAAGKADWSPLQGRDVVVWPDADEPGRKAAQTVAQQCREAGAKSVTIVDLPTDVPEGWDLADAVEAGWTPLDVQGWVNHNRIDATEQIKTTTNRYLDAIIPGPTLLEAFKKTLDMSWIAQDLWPELAEIVILWGSYNTYKSFLAVDILASIATGTPWHGRATTPKTVVYIPAEGQAGTLKRIVGWMHRHKIDNLHNFHLLPLPCLLDYPEQLDELIQALNAMDTRPDIVAFDTLARSMSGDENKTADMNKIVLACDRLRTEANVKVMIIHHTGKDNTKGSRGSIALPGGADTEIKIEKTAEKTVKLTCIKQKDYPEFEPIGFTMESQDTGYVDGSYQPVTTLVPIQHDNIQFYADSQPRLSGANRIALDALRKALEEHSQQPPSYVVAQMDASDAQHHVVHEDVWRDVAYNMGISEKDKNAKKQAFSRARKKLMDLNLIRCWEDFYWVSG